jgi:uncharacterized protein (TIGR02001 family)
MKLKQLSALCLAASALTAAPAMAWESADGQFSTSASVALSTDYMWRGASQTDNEAAISGSFDVNHASGFYAGAWASNVKFDIGGVQAHIEIDAYAGYANEIGDTGIGYDVGFMRYFFPGTDTQGDWNEVYAAVNYSHFGLKVSHTEDFGGSHEAATHYHFTFNHELPMGAHLHAGYAFYDFDDIDDVFGTTPNNIDNPLQDYGIGVSKDFAGFNWDVTYYETLSEGKDATENAGSTTAADSRFVLTISKSL